MIKKVLIAIFFIVVAFSQLSAKIYDCLYLGDIYNVANQRNVRLVQDSCGNNVVSSFENLPRNAKVMKTTHAEVIFKDVTVTTPGTLADVLGDAINEIDSLVVRGTVNASDIYTMWCCSFYGGLTVLNLEYTEIQGKKLPTDAFWHQDEQYTPGSEYIYCIPLRRIMLPEGLEEIGESAFGYAICLEDINFPSSLRTIKRRCFSDCIRLNVNPLIIPEGVEEIGYMAFVNCNALTGKVVLPTTLKKISGGAFFSTKITECNFPDGLEEIGDAAFYATRLKEAILPNSCQTFSGSDHFALNYELEKFRFPDGVTIIPIGFVDDCIKLTEFIMPNSVEEIGKCAFWQCGALKELNLSSNLKTIDTEGLYYCKGLKTINFPATLETLGGESCDFWKCVESIYCAAQIPPTCLNSTVNPGWTPFGKYGDNFANRTPQDTPVYVPVGSADLYLNAWGWNYFTNFIETDEFPWAGVDDVSVDKVCEDGAIYDLQGRKVLQPVDGHLYIRNGKAIIYRQ